MKNFSLKALGAFLFAAGLVVAGVAAPAQAAPNITMVTNPVPTFTSNSTSPAFTITIDNNNTFAADGSPDAVQLQFEVRSTNGAGGIWFPGSNTCASTMSSNNLANCGISSITGTGVGTPQVKNAFGALQFKGLGSATSVTIAFDPGAFTTAAGSGSFDLKATTGAMGQTTFVYQITVAAGVTSVGANFLGNGATGGSMTPLNSSTGSIVMPASTYTKTGYTFAGWRAGSANSGTIYQVGETAPLSVLTSFYAQWAIVGGGGSSAAASLTLNATTGQLIAGSTVGVSASGLQSTAAYTVTVQSTPQTIGSGNAVSGSVNTNVTLPSGLEAGWHTLTFTSTASNGSAVESKYYFKISASGTLLSTSSTIPAELANTGINSATGISLLAGGLSLALVGVEMFMIARRKRSN